MQLFPEVFIQPIWRNHYYSFISNKSLLELMHQVRGDAGARGSERVSERGGASVHVQLLDVQLQGLGARQGLRAERLVDLLGN